MIDKKISLGTILTLITIVATFIFTQGATHTKIENLESSDDDSRKKVMANREKIQNIQVDVARIESKIDEGFKRIEQLFFDK